MSRLISAIYGNNVYNIKKAKKVQKKKLKYIKQACIINKLKARLIERATDAEIAFMHILIDLRVQYEFQKEFELLKQ